MSLFSTCSYVLKNGPKTGMPCGESFLANGETLCPRCKAREDFYRERLGNKTKFVCQHKDPYSNDPCTRVAVYQGYCLLCLSYE